MAGFADTYLGQLRQAIGSRLVLMPGARIVIEDPAGRVLLQLRSDFNLWGLPGGNAEIGEDLTSVILREAQEEVGLSIRDARPFGFASDPQFETITYPNGDRGQYFILMFHARSFEGEPRVADDESHAVEWFAPDALPPNMLSNMRRSVEAYQRFKTTGEFQMI
jgi:ADP-ribose pyrophosphatase YjhB (NUDIX family)